MMTSARFTYDGGRFILVRYGPQHQDDGDELDSLRDHQGDSHSGQREEYDEWASQ